VSSDTLERHRHDHKHGHKHHHEEKTETREGIREQKARGSSSEEPRLVSKPSPSPEAKGPLNSPTSQFEGEKYFGASQSGGSAAAVSIGPRAQSASEAPGQAASKDEGVSEENKPFIGPMPSPKAAPLSPRQEPKVLIGPIMSPKASASAATTPRGMEPMTL